MRIDCLVLCFVLISLVLLGLLLAVVGLVCLWWGGACDCEVLGLLAWLGCLWLCLCVLWLMVWDVVLVAAWVGSMAMISGLFAVVGLLVRFGRAVWDVINITLFCL